MYYEDLLEEICKEKQSFSLDFREEIEKIRQYFYKRDFIEDLTLEKLMKQDAIYLEFNIRNYRGYCSLMEKNIESNLLDLLMNEL